MSQPEGYTHEGEEHLVYKLKKSLYGLKQSPRCWNIALTQFLTSIGFCQSSADPCIYVRGSSIIAAYMDDLIIATQTEEEL